MEEETDSRFKQLLFRLFGLKNEPPIEKTIMEALEEGELKADEVAMLLNVLRLGRKRVEEIMIPRPDIVCAEVGASLQDVAGLIMTSGHSRIPLYKQNRDQIVGIVHAKDLLKVLMAGEPGLRKPRELMRKPFFIPETKNTKDLLQEFRVRRVHLAIAQDEYGGTSGLVTFEDVLEEIVGEIEDEHDAPRPEDIQVLGDGNLLVSGRTQLEDIEDRLDLELASEQVETMGGYLCELAGRVPEEGERFYLGGYRFHVQDADPRQVRWILIEQPSSGGDAAGEAERPLEPRS